MYSQHIGALFLNMWWDVLTWKKENIFFASPWNIIKLIVITQRKFELEQTKSILYHWVPVPLQFVCRYPMVTQFDSFHLSVPPAGKPLDTLCVSLNISALYTLRYLCYSVPQFQTIGNLDWVISDWLCPVSFLVVSSDTRGVGKHWEIWYNTSPRN